MGKRMLVLAVALALTLSLALARAEEREIDRGAYIQREEDGWVVYAPDGTRLIPAGTYAFIYRSDDHWIHIRDDDWHEGLLAPDGSVLLEPEWWLPLYVCGDRETAAGGMTGLMAPRVAVCAGHQANQVLQLILQ